MIRLNTWKGCGGGNLASEEKKKLFSVTHLFPGLYHFPQPGIFPEPLDRAAVIKPDPKSNKPALFPELRQQDVFFFYETTQ